VRQKRCLWRQRQAFIRARPDFVKRLVFIDETYLNTKMFRLRGRALRGQRCHGHVPFGHWHTTSFIAGLRINELTAPMILKGPIDGESFAAYVEQFLAPTLSKGDIIIMDNLPTHKNAVARKAIEKRGAWILFLPPYSPDMNPIERAFSKFKAHFRAHTPRTLEEIHNAAKSIIDLFSPNECQNFFKAQNYL